MKCEIQAGSPSRRVVLMYRDELFRGSETFIRAQAEGLSDYEVHYAGWKQYAEPPLLLDRVHLLGGGGFGGLIRRIAFLATGYLGKGISPLVRLAPDLIHAHFGPDGVTAMPLARKLNVPLVVTFYGYDVTVKDTYARRSFSRHGLYLLRREELKRFATLFIAMSQFIEGRLIAQGFPQERIVTHYTGIDLDRFDGEPGLPREPIVLFVGRMVEGKGGTHLLRAMSLVRAQHPEARVVLLGDGPERKRLEQLATELRVPAEFLGMRAPEEVRSWLSRASVFSVPSITAPNGWQEGFGMVFLEALACGVPVVSYAVGGIPEAVGNGIGGLLCPEGDWRALANALNQLLSDSELRLRFGREGQLRTRRLFDLRRQSAILESIYDRVLSGQAIPGALANAAGWSTLDFGESEP